MPETKTRAERRREIAAERKAAKSKRAHGVEAQLPTSYVLLKDGRQVELRRSMVHLKELRRVKEPIMLMIDGEKMAIPWESIADISPKQF